MATIAQLLRGRYRADPDYLPTPHRDPTAQEAMAHIEREEKRRAKRNESDDIRKQSKNTRKSYHH